MDAHFARAHAGGVRCTLKITKTITLFLLLYIAWRMGYFYFSYHFNPPVQVGPTYEGTLVSFERNEEEFGNRHAKLAIRSKDGQIREYEKAKGGRHEIGEKVFVREYKTKLTGRESVTYHQ